MVRKNQNKQASMKNKHRFNPTVQQQTLKTPVVSTSGSGEQLDPSSASDAALIENFFKPLTPTPPNVLDKDEYLPIEDDPNMKMDQNKDFTVITRSTPFACAATIPKSPKDLPTATISKIVNAHFALDDAFRRINVRYVNLVRSIVIYFNDQQSIESALNAQFPDLDIKQLVQYATYKENMQFPQRTLRITDIHLNLKKEQLTNIFAKYSKIVTVQMFTRDLWQQAYITYEDPKSVDLFHTQWSRFIYNDCVRVYPACLTPEQVKQRNYFRMRLTN